jgi:hypothetical protein
VIDGERNIVDDGVGAVELAETPQFDRRHVPSVRVLFSYFCNLVAGAPKALSAVLSPASTTS